MLAGIPCPTLVVRGADTDLLPLDVAQRMERGNIVCLLADGGWKYLSTGLWTKEYADLEVEVEGRVWW